MRNTGGTRAQSRISRGGGADPGGTGGDGEPVQGVVDDHLVGAEFGGDVRGRAQLVAILLAQPVRVDGERRPTVVQRDAESFGDASDDVTPDPGVLGELAEVASLVDVFAVEELAGEQAEGALFGEPGGRRGVSALLALRTVQPLESEPDVFDVDTQSTCRFAWRTVFVDDEAADGVRVQRVGVDAG